MTTTKRIRITRQDRKRLKALADHPLVQEEAESEDPSYEEVLQVVLPEAGEDTILSRPEEDMVFVNLEDMYGRTHELAGENVSAHRVIKHYVDTFVERHEIEVELDG